MFKFLREKLRKAVGSFSRKVEKEVEEKEVEAEQEVKEEKKPEKKEEKISKKEKPEEELEEIKEEIEEYIEKAEQKEKEKQIEKESEEAKKKKEEEEKEEKKKQELERKQAEKKQEKEEPEEKEVLEESPEREVQEIEESIREEVTQARPGKEKKSFFKQIFRKKEKEEKEEKKKQAQEKREEKKKKKQETKKKKEAEKKEETEKPEEEKEEEPEKQKHVFRKIREKLTTIKLSEDKFEKLFWDLEMALLENNVAVEVIDKIKTDLKQELTTGKVSRKGIAELIEDSLKKSIESLFTGKEYDLVKEVKNKKDKPYVIAFIGVNGSGKTTTMAKVAQVLKKNNLSVVFAASDTFRAAAIQQLEEHAKKLGIKMIKHDYESDPAAVAFDAVKHAKAKNIDAVLIDTAGRLHSNDNLMNELKKLVRVNNPDLKVFVGESITGNDCVEQAKLFNQEVGIDVIILAKADIDEKGGAAVSVSYVTDKPIIYLGTGQKYEDLKKFEPEIVTENIGL